MAKTAIEVFEACVKKHGSRPALKVKRNGSWQTPSYNEYKKEVETTARAFKKLGLEAGKGVSIIGYNCCNSVAVLRRSQVFLPKCSRDSSVDTVGT